MRSYLPLLGLPLIFCANAPEYVPPSVAPSSYSGVFTESSRSTVAFSSPTARSDALVVRPDLISMSFSIWVEGADTAALKAEVTGLEQKLATTLPGWATRVVMCGVRQEGGWEATKLVAEGRIEVPLPPEKNFWERAQVVTALSAWSNPVQRPSKAESEKTYPKKAWGGLVYSVAQPEKYRETLVAQWTERVQIFTSKAATAPIHLTECTPPAQVEQRALSLEEVELYLTVNCKLAVLPQ